MRTEDFMLKWSYTCIEAFRGKVFGSLGVRDFHLIIYKVFLIINFYNLLEIPYYIKLLSRYNNL